MLYKVLDEKGAPRGHTLFTLTREEFLKTFEPLNRKPRFKKGPTTK